jgi:glucokinase
MIDRFRAKHEVVAIGVGAAGIVEWPAGRMLWAPNNAYRDWPVREQLEKFTSLPVVVDNDANVAALGEVLHGAGRRHREALLVTLGTGIGGGLIVNGVVYRGGFGLAAEIGHFTVDPAGPPCACGARGHWEAVASGTALGRRAREWAARGDAPNVLARAGGVVDAVTGHDVGQAAAAGEADGLAILTEHARAVAVGLGGLINILDPEVVVISGGLIDLGEYLLGPLRQVLPEYVEAPDLRPMPAVLPAVLGDQAGAVGAAALARTVLPPP